MDIKPISMAEQKKNILSKSLKQIIANINIKLFMPTTIDSIYFLKMI